MNIYLIFILKMIKQRRMEKIRLTLCGVLVLISNLCFSQITERERPKEWNQLVDGGRFMDRFLPMKGNILTLDTWGASYVKPRYVDNGIEDRVWSYWGGNIRKGDDGLFHLFVCGWLECSPKGHMEWPDSYVFNAVSDNPVGPFKIRNVIGKGHNPEVFQLNDGRYVLYVIDGHYVTDDINGNWTYGKFDFNRRDREIIEGLSNLSFAQREDGSFLMVCRGGGIWISRDGLSAYNQLTDKRVYPDVDGRFEDPVIWRDHIQYHMIVNDWLGRLAWYLRSKDGIHWVVDPGEAYAPGIAVHADGHKEDWFKYERLKVYQDEYGRAIQANFAVIDTLKFEDKPFDSHSSKNIAIPLNPGLLLSVLNEKPITSKTKTIQVKIHAEDGFDPQKDIDFSSLRFGASSEVNFGRGSKVKTVENSGTDLIVYFDAKGHGITDSEFAPKLIGKNKQGALIYGYARLPYVDYQEAILSARAPEFSTDGVHVEVQNFGLVASAKVSIRVDYRSGDKYLTLASGSVPVLAPYEKSQLLLSTKKTLEKGSTYELMVTIYSGKKTLSSFCLEKTIE